MSSNIRLNLKGINEVMSSPGVEDLLRQAGRQVAKAAGNGFEVTSNRKHPWVARAFVTAETPAAVRAQASRKVLTTALARRR